MAPQLQIYRPNIPNVAAPYQAIGEAGSQAVKAIGGAVQEGMELKQFNDSKKVVAEKIAADMQEQGLSQQQIDMTKQEVLNESNPEKLHAYMTAYSANSTARKTWLEQYKDDPEKYALAKRVGPLVYGTSPEHGQKLLEDADKNVKSFGMKQATQQAGQIMAGQPGAPIAASALPPKPIAEQPQVKAGGTLGLNMPSQVAQPIAPPQGNIPLQFGQKPSEAPETIVPQGISEASRTKMETVEGRNLTQSEWGTLAAKAGVELKDFPTYQAFKDNAVMKLGEEKVKLLEDKLDAEIKKTKSAEEDRDLDRRQRMDIAKLRAETSTQNAKIMAGIQRSKIDETKKSKYRDQANTLSSLNEKYLDNIERAIDDYGKVFSVDGRKKLDEIIVTNKSNIEDTKQKIADLEQAALEDEKAMSDVIKKKEKEKQKKDKNKISGVSPSGANYSLTFK